MPLVPGLAPALGQDVRSTVEKVLLFLSGGGGSELNVDNWNENCEAKSEAKSPRPLRGLQVDSSLTRNVPYAVCK